MALNEDGGFFRIESGGQVVQGDVEGFELEAARIGVVRGQRVPVGDEEVALVLVLQLDPVGQGAHVVAQVELAGGTHSAQNTRTGR
jgi:hypothetical protein